MPPEFSPIISQSFSSSGTPFENKKFAEAKILRRAVPYPAFDIQEKQQTFTTERKPKLKSSINISRKGSIVKERCRQLTDIALELFPDRRISDEDLDYLISRYVGGDRETRRAYKGYHGRVTRSKSSGEGYVQGQTRKGYLEIFDFMHKIGHNVWVIHAQMKLSEPQIPYHNNETSEKEKASKEKISLSQRGNSDTVSDLGHGDVVVQKQINNNNTVRERNFTPKIFPKISGEGG